MPIIDLEPSHIHDFADTLGEREVLSVGIGPDNDAVLLAVMPEHMGTATGRNVKNGGSFPHSLTHNPYPAASIRMWDADTIVSVDIPEVTATHPHVQPLANGRTLVVASRCFYLGNRGERHHL